MKSEQEIREIAQVLRNPGLPESAFLLMLRGIESDAVAEGSNGAVQSLFNTVRASAQLDTGYLDLPQLEEVIRWWLGTRGYRLPRPQGTETGSQPALSEFPLPRRRERQHDGGYEDDDHIEDTGAGDAQ